jgi:hypothetical protein
MAILSASNEPQATSISASPHTDHYVDWGAIVAGCVVTLAISSLFIAFGSAIGLTLTSFQGGKAATVTVLVVAAALWFLWVQISSFLAGGYIVGRMRRRSGDATQHEAEVRDGIHGLIVWALAVMLGTLVAAYLAIASLSVAGNSKALDYDVDKMLRGTTPSVAAPFNDTSPISRALVKNIGTSAMDESDKTYLVNEISSRSGVSQVDAQIRLDQTIATLKAQADRARRLGILAGFLTAASLLIGAVAAWWAAQTGGRHRNEGTDYSHLVRWR